MNLHFFPFTGNPPEKKGFALILTLSVLVVVMALTGVMISYMDTVRQDTLETKAMIQSNLYFKDMKSFIAKFKNRKTLYTVLYAAPVPLQSEDGRFSLTLRCRPLTSGVNINWLAYGSAQVMHLQYNAAVKVFEALAVMYELEDPARLEEMIISAIGTKDSGELDDQSRLRQKNGIISYQQFMHIVTRYQFETDDKHVGDIPWDKYFVFNPIEKKPEENRIFGDYMSIELIAILFDIDIETLKEQWIPGTGALKKLLEENAVEYEPKLFSKEFVARSFCTVDFGFKGRSYRFAFVDSEGEVKDFEFYGKQ